MVVGLSAPALGTAASGDIDPTFGQAGKLRFDTEVWGIQVLPDQRFLVQVPGALKRFLPDGAPDPSFGTAGTAETGDGQALLDRLGRIILVAGGKFGCRISRFTPAGRVDRSYGVGGRTFVHIPGPRMNWARCYAAALAGQKIVLLITPAEGSVRVSPIRRRPPHFAVARVGPDGRLDRSFFDRGWRNARWDTRGNEDESYASDIAVDSRDRIVVGGVITYEQESGSVFYKARYGMFARFLPDGRFDSDFSRDGRAVAATGDEGIGPILIDRHDRILAGCTYEAAEEFWGCLVRQAADGDRDRHFGRRGAFEPEFRQRREDGSYIFDVDRSNSGDIVAVGSEQTLVTDEFGGSDHLKDEPLVLRLTARGRYDTSFSGDGVFIGNLGEAGEHMDSRSVAFQKGEHILLAVTGGSTRSFITRLLP
jgi:uncharacterized delta-60 repeat protein